MPIQQKEPLLGGVLIRFQDLKAMTTETISHESTHAALEIFNYCAYLVGWIARCCDEVKNELQKKIGD